MKHFNVITPNSSANLEHGHTKLELDGNTGDITATIVSYPYYGNMSSDPIALFAPTYSAANDISCKLVSADEFAKVAGLPKWYWPLKNPKVTCSDINKMAVELAHKLLNESWPLAEERWK